MAKALWNILGGSWLMGIYSGIYIKTGINVEPNDFIFNLIKTIVQAFLLPFQTIGVNIQFWSTIWSIIKIVFLIMGAISTIIGIRQIASYNREVLVLGIIVALSGFFGWVLFFGSGYIVLGFIFLLLGIIICYTFEGEAPEDFVSSNF